MKKLPARKIKLNKEDKLWKFYPYLGSFVRKLDELADAAAVRQNPLCSAPQEKNVMVF